MEAAPVRCQRGGKQDGDDLSVRVHGQLALLLAFLYYGRGNPASGPLPAQRDGSRRNVSRRWRAGCQCSARRALIHLAVSSPFRLLATSAGRGVVPPIHFVRRYAYECGTRVSR